MVTSLGSACRIWYGSLTRRMKTSGKRGEVNSEKPAYRIARHWIIAVETERVVCV